MFFSRGGILAVEGTENFDGARTRGLYKKNLIEFVQKWKSLRSKSYSRLKSDTRDKE